MELLAIGRSVEHSHGFSLGFHVGQHVCQCCLIIFSSCFHRFNSGINCFDHIYCSFLISRNLDSIILEGFGTDIGSWHFRVALQVDQFSHKIFQSGIIQFFLSRIAQFHESEISDREPLILSVRSGLNRYRGLAHSQELNRAIAPSAVKHITGSIHIRECHRLSAYRHRQGNLIGRTSLSCEKVLACWKCEFLLHRGGPAFSTPVAAVKIHIVFLALGVSPRLRISRVVFVAGPRPPVIAVGGIRVSDFVCCIHSTIHTFSLCMALKVGTECGGDGIGSSFCGRSGGGSGILSIGECSFLFIRCILQIWVSLGFCCCEGIVACLGGCESTESIGEGFSGSLIARGGTIILGHCILKVCTLFACDIVVISIL